MRTDYVDVIQLHNPSVAEAAAGDLVATLQEMKAQGKTRWIGISTTHPDIETFIGQGVFDTFQIPYSALQREHEDAIAQAAAAGAGVIVRGGVARGEPGAGLGSGQTWEVWEKARLDDLREEGESRTAFLLRFTHSHPGMSTNIVGTLQPDHLAENIAAAARGPLPAEVYAEAKSRLDQAAG